VKKKPTDGTRGKKQTRLTDPPKKTIGDTVHAVVKAGIGAIPVPGAGAAAELGALIFQAPIERRADLWARQLLREIRRLEKKVEGFRAEQLRDREEFITVAMYASQAAIRNHDQEKLAALRAAVLNAALDESPDDGERLTFIRLVEDLTPWHLKILSVLADPEAYMARWGIERPNIGGSSLGRLLEALVPELKGRRDLYDDIVSDLHGRSLLEIDSLHTMMTSAGLRAKRASGRGARFLKFITSPIPDDEDDLNLAEQGGDA
jgi:hypothetical protein